MDDPPSYDNATSGSSQPKTRNNIPPQARRSMEDEARDLPEGWIRQFDPNSRHHFYVDTKANPPRSIWCHPYDDVTYLRTLKVDEQERIMNMHRRPTDRDLRDESSDEEDHHAGASKGNGLPERPEHVGKFKKFGRNIKDKVTNSTHEQREGDRKARAEEEQKLYQARIKYHNALQRAANSGERQYLGKDRNGKDIYVDPPPTYAGSGMYGAGYGVPYGGAYGPGYGGYGGYGYSRYAAPGYPYDRYGGSYYGGGLGVPLGLGLGAGLLGGGLLGAAFI